MCTVCGCGTGGHRHDHARSDDPRHDHDHHDLHNHRDHLDDAGRASSPAASGGRRIRLARDLLAENDRHAADNRNWLTARRIFALNLLAGPGAGKTTLLERTITDLAARVGITVIEGDPETRFDADRVRAAGARAVQINTRHMCHLDAHMIGHALTELAPPDNSVLFVENIGNLVCPSAFDLGEEAKVVLLSVTDGDDKPLKYPDIFAAATLVLLTKTDLLPYVSFNAARARIAARTVNPSLEVLEVSAVTGAGLDRWYEWICRRRHRPRVPAFGAGTALADG